MTLTITEAEEALTKAIEVEAEIAQELTDLEGNLSQAESTAGDQCLEARKAGNQKAIKKINDEVLSLRSQRDIILSTHQAAREAIKIARHEVNLAKGRDLRKQAGDIMIVVEERNIITKELLNDLYLHEGIRFIPEPEVHAGCVVPNSFALSQTQRLQIDVDALTRQAETTEHRKVTIEGPLSTNGRKSGAIITK